MKLDEMKKMKIREICDEFLRRLDTVTPVNVHRPKMNEIGYAVGFEAVPVDGFRPIDAGWMGILYPMTAGGWDDVYLPTPDGGIMKFKGYELAGLGHGLAHEANVHLEWRTDMLKRVMEAESADDLDGIIVERQ